MNILAVDDEQLMLDALMRCISKVAPQANLTGFRRSSEALAYAEENPIDVAFLDIEMRGMNGLELGRQLLNLYPDLNVIFCTGYDEYISEAFRDVRCNGYITKPVDAEQVQKELSLLRVPLKMKPDQVRFRCFGRFEVFYGNEPMQFETSKTRELLAYLVNACGGVCENQEIIANLWDDDFRHDSYFKKIRKDLMDTLESYGCLDILSRQRGGLAILTDKVECDYYAWRQTHSERYEGEYMSQYFWANIPEYE